MSLMHGPPFCEACKQFVQVCDDCGLCIECRDCEQCADE
jgi:hypothetical protein